MDSDVSMTSQVGEWGGGNVALSTSNLEYRSNQEVLDQDTCHHIVRSFVLSRLDYGKWLLAGSTNAQLNKLLRIQNRAPRLICGAKRRKHISPYLARLHWLPVRQRVNFKLPVYIYQCLNGSSPRYFSSDIVLHSTQSSSHHYLHSQADHTRLHIPKTHRSKGDKTFFVIGPRLWNMLPIVTREAASLIVFKKLLKTYLFSHSI